MSSSGAPPDDDLWPNDAASPMARRLLSTIQASWEIQEIVAAALLLVIAVLAGAGMASAIIGGTSRVDGFANGESVTQVLFEATQWAGVFATFLILCALGLVWWQVDGWADVLEDLDEGEDRDRAAGGEESEADDAMRHIGRNRTLSTWAAVSLLVTSMAVVGAMVGLGLEASPFPWQQWVSFGGQLVGALILAAVGFFAVGRIRSRCTTALDLENEADPSPST
jgi:hypothetical protein